MLLPQLEGQPFGPRLRAELAHAGDVAIATAWVRASGVRHIREALEGVLARGGKLQVIVGLDADNTSIEGLSELIDIGAGAPDRAALYVRHNEAFSVFHPKLYVARTEKECRLFVGSNNLTGAGLFLNEEVSALLIEERGGKVESSLDAYFAALTDQSTGLVKPLTMPFLQQLIEHGYVRPEASLPGKSTNRARRNAGKGSPLFAFRAPKRRPPPPPAAPGAPRIEPSADEPAADWSRVFLRLRLSRGTQAQIPVNVVRAFRARLGETELDGPLEVAIQGKQARQRISPAYTERSGDTPNTYKFEARNSVGQPLLIMELVGDEVTVTKLDGDDPRGEIVEKHLLAGLESDPPVTFRRRHDDTATLWRFD